MKLKLTERAPGFIGTAGVPLLRQVFVGLWLNLQTHQHTKEGATIYVTLFRKLSVH